MDKDRDYSSTIPGAEPGYAGPAQAIRGGLAEQGSDRPDGISYDERQRLRENEARTAQIGGMVNQLKAANPRYGSIRDRLLDKVQASNKAMSEANEAAIALRIIERHPELLDLIESLQRLGMLPRH